jgi:hypothetical protein
MWSGMMARITLNWLLHGLQWLCVLGETMQNDKSGTLQRLALFLEREAQLQGINIEVEITKIRDKISIKQNERKN